MPDQKITEYIKEQREQKTEDPVIVSTLLQAGYTKQDIDEGLKLLSMTESTEIPVANTTSPPQQENPKPRFAFHMPGRGVMVIVAAFLTIIIGVGIFMFVSSSQSIEEEETIQDEAEEETVTPEPTEEIVEESSPTEEAAPTASLLTADERDQKRAADIQALQDALEKYFADKNVYPDNLNQLYTDYLDRIIVDPVTFRPYDYFSREQGKSYIICVTPEGKSNRQCAEKGKNPFGPTQAPAQ